MGNSFKRKIKISIEQLLLDVLYLFPYKNTVLFESEGDFSDNTYALYDYLKKNGYFESKYRAVWLVDNVKTGRDDCICIKKNTKFPNLKRLYYIATSRNYIYDHKNVLRDYRKRKGQTIFNLFHGCAFKTVKGLAGRSRSPESFLTVTGDMWTHLLAEFVGCDEGIVKSLGYPRNDYFFTDNTSALRSWNEKHDWSGYNKTILWMPTFRKSNSKALSEDYYKGDTGLPILEKVSDLIELNELLAAKNSLLVFKVHHLQSDYEAFKMKFSNICILKDEEIISCGAQLYQIVALTDALITDYSSIFNDYLLLDRPMIFTLDDYEEYRRSRGFSIDDPAEYCPGDHVYDKDQLFHAINDVLDGKDKFREDREKVTPLMHKYKDGNSSKRITEFIGL